VGSLLKGIVKWLELYEYKKIEVMEQLKGGILISPKDIQIITGLSNNRASREHQAIRDALGKTCKRLTIKEYCDYNQLNLEEVITYLNANR
jgi:type IV secretory pathway VirB4 component